MLISYEWLNEYIEIKDLKPDEIAETLTHLGLEVESVTTGNLCDSKVVVGKILTAEQHPNANSLRVCQVDVGVKEPLTIVCGAPNARAGIFVAVAKVGAVLPGDFKIKSSKIRGEKSQGMMCSASELRISDDHDGIIELEGTPTCGSHIQPHLPEQNSIFDISLTPNRGDCLSYIGIARDLGAKLKRPIKIPECKRDNFTDATLKTSDHLTIKIDSDELSARFMALYIEGIEKDAKTPFWLQKRLEDSGMRSVNLIVDVTNYVMLENGQPIHAYDSQFVEDATIQVKLASHEEKLKTLDGKTHDLDERDITIYDGKRPIGLAGIMGGENTEVRADSQSIFLEVAQFAPQLIRSSAKRRGLSTEASHRFEKGIDIGNIEYVLFRFAEILCACMEKNKHKVPRVARYSCDFYPQPINKKRIALRIDRLKRVTGMFTPTTESCVKHLSSLGFHLIDKTKDRMLFEIPTWRPDISREIDLIEEYTRVEGYDKVPYELPRMSIEPNKEHSFISFVESTKISFATQGLCEVMTFPFLSLNIFKKLNIHPKHFLWPSLKLKNALNEEMAYLQTSLIPSLLESIRYNRHKGHKSCKLFEVGRGYFGSETKSSELDGSSIFSAWTRKEKHLTNKAKSEHSRPSERYLLSGVLDQPWSTKSWNKPEESTNFYHGKKILAAVMKTFGIRKLDHRPLTEIDVPFLHPGNSSVLSCNEKIIGWLGELHPQCAVACDLGNDAPILFELDLESIFDLCLEKKSFDTKLWKYPAVGRDLSLGLEKTRSYKELLTAVDTFPGKKNLRSIKLFDIYSGDKVAAGEKSVAAKFIFQSSEKTLTDKEVDQEIQQLLLWLQQSIGARQR